MMKIKKKGCDVGVDIAPGWHIVGSTSDLVEALTVDPLTEKLYRVTNGMLSQDMPPGPFARKLWLWRTAEGASPHRGVVIESASGVQVLWLNREDCIAYARQVPGSVTSTAAALQDDTLFLLHASAGRVERWHLHPDGFDQPDVFPLDLPPKAPLCAYLHVRHAATPRLLWIDTERAIWGAPRGLVHRSLPLEIEDARFAGILGDRAYVLIQQRAVASHGPWLWIGFDLASPDLPLWVAPALRPGLMPYAACVCERYGLLIATREGIWWFDRQGRRRDRIAWPDPDAAARAEHMTLTVAPNKRSLYASMDGTIWQWSMAPLRGRTLPTLRAQDIPPNATPCAEGPDGLVGWRRPDEPPCWSRPGSGFSRAPGLIDLAVDPDHVWELFENGRLRVTPHDRAAHASKDFLVVPAPERLSASADAVVFASCGYASWLASPALLPAGSLRYEGLSGSLTLRHGPGGWLLGDARRLHEVFFLPPKSAFLGLRVALPAGSIAHPAPNTFVLLSENRLWRIDPEHPSPVPFADLPPNTLSASLRPDARGLVIQDAHGLILWPDLDQARAARLLLMPAIPYGWIGEDLLVALGSEGWRVSINVFLASKPPPPKPPDGIPLSPCHHLPIDQSDLTPPVRANLQSLCAEASVRWPDQPDLSIPDTLRRAALALTAAQRLAQQPDQGPLPAVALSPEDILILSPLLEPHTLDLLARITKT